MFSGRNKPDRAQDNGLAFDSIVGTLLRKMIF